MGSIISFPVLCIINATVCRMALEVGQRKRLNLEDCFLLINGDDCLFRTNEAGYAFWKATTTTVGLIPSLGKVLWHKRIAQINSRNFSFERKYFLNHEFKPVWCRMIPVVMMGLYMMLKRSSSEMSSNSQGRDVGTLTSLGSRVRTFLNLAPRELRDSLYGRFVRDKIKPRLIELQRKVNSICVPWYVPAKFGGLGLPLPPGRDLSRRDRNFCYKIVTSDINIMTERTEQSWQTYQCAVRRLRKSGVELTRNTATDADLGLGNFYMIELFLSKWNVANLSFGDPNKIRDSLRFLRINSAAWRRSLRNSFQRPPVGFNPLESECGELRINGCELKQLSYEQQKKFFYERFPQEGDVVAENQLEEMTCWDTENDMIAVPSGTVN
jgi:hypothetical protein